MITPILLLWVFTLVSSQSFLNETYFARLLNYQVNAELTNENTYPWIAKIVHSRYKNYPTFCTASCINENVFVTSGSCVQLLKIKYTRVIYKGVYLPVRVLILPSNETKQQYDDVGFIITRNEYSGNFTTVNVDSNHKRLDDEFKWFNHAYYVKDQDKYPIMSVGYATTKENRIPLDKTYSLYRLNVTLDINICTTLHSIADRIRGFHVPCYFGCSLREYNNRSPLCNNYLGTEGAAVIVNVYKRNTTYLIGVATWGAQHITQEMPVGFAVLNSPSFLEDHKCAIAIGKDRNKEVDEGYYEALCQISKDIKY